MAGFNWLAVLDKEYYNSGKWKCPLSPTGGHHSVHKGNGIFICKYCFDVQKRPMTFLDAMEFQSKQIAKIKARWRENKKKKGGKHGEADIPHTL